MKRIECIIRPHRLDDVKVALAEMGVVGMTVEDVRGCGSHEEMRDSYRGADYTVYLLPRIRLTMVVPDEDVDEVLDTVCQYARTGEPGDGKIFIYPMDDAVRVRTEERGDAVL